MGILSWILLGALAGWVASIFTGRNASMGAVANIVVGIGGAIVGGYVMSMVNGQGVTGFNLPSFLVALLGSVILLAIINFFNKGKRI